MRILLAKPRGFCYGVRRSLEIAGNACGFNKSRAEENEVYSLGSLIHNSSVMKRLGACLTVLESVSEVDDLPSIPAPTLLIRSHGESPDVFKIARAKGITVADATCPTVRRNQRLLAALGEEGYYTVIVGDREHSEVKSLVGWAKGRYSVLDTVSEAIKLPVIPRLAIMSQTTARVKLFEDIAAVLAYKTNRLRLCPSICSETEQRQNTIKELCGIADIMLIIGGRESANTRNLCAACVDSGVSVFLLETAEDLCASMLSGANIIGIGTGTSTPDWIIEEVVNKMLETENISVEEFSIDESVVPEQVDSNIQLSLEGESQKIIQDTSEGAADNADAVSPPKSARNTVQATSTEGQNIIEEHLNKNFESFRTGSRAKGKVVMIRDGELLVDIGGKSEGILPASELPPNEAEDIRRYFNIGDEIEVLILIRENKEGYPVLSKRRVDQDLVWDRLKEAVLNGEPVTGKIVEAVKGGLIADVGVRGFIPASMVTIGYVGNIKVFVGKELPMKVVECDKEERRLILSPKAVMVAEQEARRSKRFSSIEAGQVVRGKVCRVTNYGAFVDIGGVDGLIHISEMTWGRVSDPSDIVKEGDEIEVCVLDVDYAKKRVSLSLRQLLPNPWAKMTEKYPVGAVVPAKAMRIVTFGVFMELEPGVEGLVHISRISNNRLVRIEDYISVGDIVNVKVLNVDVTANRISLSIKEAGDSKAAAQDGDTQESVSEDLVNTD